jgi:hypothetical protein
MSGDPTGGELSPANTPQPSQRSQPSTSSTPPTSAPTPTPTFEQKRGSQSRSPAAPRERAPAAPNPRATRPPHWSDAGTAEGRAIAASRARRGETSPTATSPAPAAPGAEPGEGERQQPTGGEKHRFGDDLELTTDEIKDLLAHKASADSRRLTLP